MKSGIHPSNYRPVVFADLNNGTSFLTRSTASTEETTTWEDGKEYPLVKVHISSASHPFFTGQEKLVDVEGRVDRFKARREAADAARNTRGSKVAKNQKRREAKVAKETKDTVAAASKTTNPDQVES